MADGARSDGARRALAFVALEAALLVPLVAARFPPLVDWPEHVATVGILARLARGSAFDAATYATDLFPNTNVAFFALATPLAPYLGVEGASRLVLAATILAAPLAVAWLAREATGAVSWASLLVFPVAYHTSVQFGFVNWLLALPAVIAWFAAQLRWQRAATPAARALVGAALVALPGFVFAAHAQAWLFGLGGTAVIAWFHRGDRARAAAPALAALPSIAVFAAWYATHFGGPGAGSTRFEGVGTAFGAWFPPFGSRLTSFVGNLVAVYPGPHDDWALAAWALAAVGWLWLARGAAWTPGRAAVTAIAAAAGLGYFALPDRIAQQWFISQRMLPLAVLLAIAAFPPAAASRARAAVVALAVAATAAMLGVVTREYTAFSETIAQEHKLLAEVPPEVTLLGLPFEPRSEHATRMVYLHTASYYLVHSPGILGHSFYTLPSYPVRMREPGPPSARGPGAEFDPWCGILDGEGADADYLLLHGKDHMLIFALGDAVAPVGEAGDWTLVRRVGEIEIKPAIRAQLRHQYRCE